MAINISTFFPVSAGCIVTQQDGESIPVCSEQIPHKSCIKSMYMHIQAAIFFKIYVILENNFRQIRRLQYTIFKATELQLWLTRYSVIKLRFPLIKTTRVLSQVFHKSPILKGYTIFLNALTGLNAHRKELEKTHKFLFGDYPKEIGSHTDV